MYAYVYVCPEFHQLANVWPQEALNPPLCETIVSTACSALEISDTESPGYSDKWPLWKKGTESTLAVPYNKYVEKVPL